MSANRPTSSTPAPKRRKTSQAVTPQQSTAQSSASAEATPILGIERADVISGQHVVNSTRKQYASTFKYITKYCAESIPGSVDADGELILPMSTEHLKAFLGDMGAVREDKTIKSLSTLNNYINTIKHYYKERLGDDSMSTEQKNYLKKFSNGYGRVMAQARDRGEMKQKEGKVPVSFSMYQELCRLALFIAATRSAFSSFVHLFLILCWNLFARSCSVADLRTHHFSWENDSLVIDFSKQKGDQTGEHIAPKHIYANPYTPSVCPMLALALHMFSCAFRPDNDDESRVFLGTPYDVFSKWLPTALTIMEKAAVLGYAIGDFGTHSFRKGIATFCSGLIGGPSVIAIFIRAGWSLGQVQDRYISAAEGGDQLCGRVACGLDFNGGSTFSVLPPHFDRMDILTAEEWAEIVPMYAEYPVGFQACLPFLLASLVFHWDWINERDSDGELKNICAEHPIFLTRVVTSGIVTRLKDRVIGNITSGKCPATGMIATGIPPHIELHRQNELLREEIKQLRQQLQEQHDEVMNRLPTLVTEKVLGNVRVEGVQQLSRSDMEDLISGLVRKYTDEHAPVPVTAPPQPGDVANQFYTRNGHICYPWGGMMYRSVPEGWRFPTETKVKVMCDLFLTGLQNQEKPIRPFRFIEINTLLRADQQYFSKAMYVFDAVRKVAVSIGSLQNEEELNSITMTRWDLVFKDAFNYIVSQIELQQNKQLRKPGELAVNTFYKYLLAANSVAGA